MLEHSPSLELKSNAPNLSNPWLEHGAIRYLLSAHRSEHRNRLEAVLALGSGHFCECVSERFPLPIKQHLHPDREFVGNWASLPGHVEVVEGRQRAFHRRIEDRCTCEEDLRRWVGLH